MKAARLAGLALLLLALSAVAPGQDLLVHSKLVRLRHLQGTVVDPRGFPVEYAVVELRDVQDHVLASTFADAQGRFAFSDKKRGQRFKIRASQKGFNLAQYTVAITFRGGWHMRVVLSPAG